MKPRCSYRSCLLKSLLLFSSSLLPFLCQGFSFIKLIDRVIFARNSMECSLESHGSICYLETYTTKLMCVFFLLCMLFHRHTDNNSPSLDWMPSSSLPWNDISCLCDITRKNSEGMSSLMPYGSSTPSCDVCHNTDTWQMRCERQKTWRRQRPQQVWLDVEQHTSEMGFPKKIVAKECQDLLTCHVVFEDIVFFFPHFLSQQRSVSPVTAYVFRDKKRHRTVFLKTHFTVGERRLARRRSVQHVISSTIISIWDKVSSDMMSFLLPDKSLFSDLFLRPWCHFCKCWQWSYEWRLPKRERGCLCIYCSLPTFNLSYLLLVLYYCTAVLLYYCGFNVNPVFDVPFLT